jgi:hypothetical protein
MKNFGLRDFVTISLPGNNLGEKIILSGIVPSFSRYFSRNLVEDHQMIYLQLLWLEEQRKKENKSIPDYRKK